MSEVILDDDFQCNQLADIDDLELFILLVQQHDLFNYSLPGAGNGLHLAIVGNLLPHSQVFPLSQHGIVIVHNRFRLSLHCQFTSIKQDGTITDGLDGALVVGDDQQSCALLAECTDAVKTFVLEIGVAHRQSLIDDEHIGPRAVATLKAKRICMPLE